MLRIDIYLEVMIKLKLRPVATFGSLLFAFVVQCVPAFAFTSIDSFSGVDQSFTDGFSFRSTAEKGHDNFAFREERERSQKEEKSAKDYKDSEREWRFHKLFQTGVLFDSNPESSQHDPDGDLVYGYNSSLGMSRRSENVFFSLFTNNSYSDYVENQKNSRYSNSENMQYNLNFKRLKINISDSFKPDTALAVGERTELLPGGEASSASDLSKRKVYTYSNSLNIDSSYTLSPKTSLTYNHIYSYYYFPVAGNSETTNSFSSKTNTFRPGVTYKIRPKVNVFANYALEMIDYFEAKGDTLHPQTHTFSTGLDWKMNPKTGLGFSVSYLLRDYLTDHIKNIDGLVLTWSVSRQITQKIFATASFSKDVQQSLDQSMNSSLQEDKYFYGLNLTWKITQKMFLSGQVSAQLNSREGFVTLRDVDNETLTFTRPMEDQSYRWGLGFNWNLKKDLIITLLYEFLNHNSSFKNFEYEDHRALAAVNFKF